MSKVLQPTSIGVLYSGGKDSTFVCELLRERGLEVACLISVISENDASYMLHTASIEMTTLSSQAMEIPLVQGASKGDKESELFDIEEAILEARRKFGIDGIASGALGSQYQKTRIESIGSNCGLVVLSPLWQVNQSEHFFRLLSRHYRIIMTSVSAEGLGPEWLGNEITIDSLRQLQALSRKFKFNLALEGGEAETLVLDCPIFKKVIEIQKSNISWNGYYGVLKIEQATLVEKKT